MTKHPLGFSLIELLLVITLIAIISSFTAIGLHHALEKQKQYSRLLELGRIITYAQNYAITHHTSVTLCPSSTHTTCQGQWSQGAILLAAHKTLLIYTALPKGHQLVLQAYPSAQVLQFSALGSLASTNGKFSYILPTGEMRNLLISKSGRVRFSDS